MDSESNSMEAHIGQHLSGSVIQPVYQNCPICGDDLGSRDFSVLTSKGCKRIVDASKQRKENLQVFPGQKVHKDCRSQYTNPLKIKQTLSEKSKDLLFQIPTLRSKENFSFATHCLFCAQPAKIIEKKRGPDVFPVRTTDFQNNILAACDLRRDEWAVQVRGRIQSINDLHAADALYHQPCSVNFRTQKQVPLAFSPSGQVKKSKGRPSSQYENFQKIVTFIDDSFDQFTLADLTSKMRSLCGDEAFTSKHLKRRLFEHYGNDIIFTAESGRPDIITVRKAVAPILRAFYERPKDQDEDSEKQSIINTAAKLIRNDILAMDQKSEMYPSPSDVSSKEKNLQYLPNSLTSVLRGIMHNKSDLKIAAIGQAIAQAARPRGLLPPLQLGLGVQLHHQYGSRFLIETLNALGFCSSYSEVNRFECSAAQQQGTDLQGFNTDQFIQYSADNVDHNTCTLDGKGTFHGMGIIACVTPGTDNTESPLKRLSVSQEDIQRTGRLDLKFYEPPSNMFATLSYGELKEIKLIDNMSILDFSSSLLWSLRQQQPGWSGIMQTCLKGSYPGKSSVKFLPMIDMSASDPSCIYSTMHFVCDHARRYNISAILTFDQPLFWKASIIVENEPVESPLKSIVLRLGAFHTQMSFLGCIGHVMSGSGLQAVIETVYAPNAVSHILTGKAISRAVRAHQLVETALHSILMSRCYNIPCFHPKDNEETESCEREFQPEVLTESSPNISASSIDPISNASDELPTRLQLQFSLLLEGLISSEDFCNNADIKAIQDRIDQEKLALRGDRTSQLWLQYLQMISLLKAFIRAERTGNWTLHIATLMKMLPFFAASGHNLYAKSAYWYIMKMQELPKTHPDVYSNFMQGHHVLRRSDRFWAGLSSDLMIEQVLMRSLKTSGGLTHGRGMNESQRNKWLLSMPACADMNNCMQFVTDVGFETSDQHKETFESRRDRDSTDIKLILGFIQERNPFSGNGPLRNIETGQVGDKVVDVEHAEHIGKEILKSMAGSNILGYTFKKSKQVITLNSKVDIKIEGDTLNVDPQLLFQRLITAAKFNTDDIPDLFKYELSGVPSSLFESTGLPREANKPQIAEFIWKMGTCGVPEVSVQSAVYVIDGGSLLQKIPWIKGETFLTICEKYARHIKQKYSRAVVVFDGYSAGPSTKDVTHLRRSKGIVTPRVIFTEDMPFKSKKEIFLTNTENKQQFIKLLSLKLEECEVETRHAVDDADTLIVETAVEFSTSNEVVLIGEDTDLLILLCYHAKLDGKNIYFKSDRLKGQTKIWDIHKTKLVLGQRLCKRLPAIHALTGCDTTSRLYGIGKGVALKKLLSNEYMFELTGIFLEEQCEKGNLLSAGEEIIAFLYGGIEYETLDLLRFRRFVQRTATSSGCVQIQDLPPTSDAAKLHVQRSYLQCQIWIGNQASFAPDEFGWYFTNNRLHPTRSILPPAPEHLLKVIKCNCKQGCESNRCTCKKHGLECSVACGECRGVSCSNSRLSVDDMECDD